MMEEQKVQLVASVLGKAISNLQPDLYWTENEKSIDNWELKLNKNKEDQLWKQFLLLSITL